jgi:hypothetical protein
MNITPPKSYSEEHLKSLLEDLRLKNSYLAEFIYTSKFDNKALFNRILKESHSTKLNSHTKNLIRSIRVVMYEIPLEEIPIWLNEDNLELKAILQWRLSTVG